MTLLTLHGTSRLLPVSQPRHYEPVPPVLSENSFRGSGHLPHAPFHFVPMLWVAADLYSRLNYLLQALFGQLLGQHRVIGLHGVPDDQVLEAGVILVQGDLVPGPDRTPPRLHHASLHDFMHSGPRVAGPVAGG